MTNCMRAVHDMAALSEHNLSLRGKLWLALHACFCRTCRICLRYVLREAREQRLR